MRTQAYAIPPDSPTLTTQNSVSQQDTPAIQPSPQPVQAAQDARKQGGTGVERTQAYAIPPDSPMLTKQIVSDEQAEQRFFYVGDVKQSIYRFRQADPTLFMEKEAAFSDDAAAPRRRIDLNRNYRSRSAVITAVNRVFERIMRRDVTEIAYDSRARLYAGQETEGDPPLRLHIFTTPLKAADRVRVQAAAIGQEIVKRVGQPYFDRKENRHRTLRYRDIAVLAPRMKGVDEVITRALQALHIPAYAEGSGAGLQSDEIAQVLCHLKLMDNIQDDLSLLAALRSPAIGMEDAELAEVRIRHNTGSYLEALRETAAGSDALARRCAGALQTIEHERFSDAQHAPARIPVEMADPLGAVRVLRLPALRQAAAGQPPAAVRKSCGVPSARRGRHPAVFTVRGIADLRAGKRQPHGAGPQGGRGAYHVRPQIQGFGIPRGVFGGAGNAHGPAGRRRPGACTKPSAWRCRISTRCAA